uniref:Uncharacterized protein n=1 Tax=Arundo donax TaxID=35708 RepID=A0A0A9C4X5_ARUDO
MNCYSLARQHQKGCWRHGTGENKRTIGFQDLVVFSSS